MSDFSPDLQEPLTWFHKPTMDPTRIPSPNPKYYTDNYEDLLSANDPSTKAQPLPALVAPYDKEPMFEKPLTPSDVGKLNRLVIPKQHAEKYFPLGSGDAAGTLLGFEDEAGKCWRFRYSYWNSSQSYVLTKGWSRYVKDKRLDAGDVVFFERHRADPDRLYIGWRHRGAPAPQHTSTGTAPFCYNAMGYQVAQDSREQGLPQYQPDCQYAGEAPAKGEQNATPGSSASNNNSKKLVRLFGVNLECQLDDSSSHTTSSEGSSLSSHQQQQRQAYNAYFNYMGYPPTPNYHYHHHHHHRMDMSFPQGINQMGNRLG